MKTRTGRLKRTKNTYEFLARYPYGASTMNGYRRAARHFGLHTLEDPGTIGSDTFRLLVHKSVQKLREAARVLSRAYLSDNQTLIDKAEAWLDWESGVSWFDHDWKHWDPEQDGGALERLGWKRTVVESGKSCRITLRITGKRGPRLRN